AHLRADRRRRGARRRAPRAPARGAVGDALARSATIAGARAPPTAEPCPARATRSARRRKLVRSPVPLCPTAPCNRSRAAGVSPPNRPRRRAGSCTTHPRGGDVGARAAGETRSAGPHQSRPVASSAHERHRVSGAHLMDLVQVRAVSEEILDEVEQAVVGKRDALELVFLGFLADGHVLLEDYPGLAKTLAARSFAQ